MKKRKEIILEAKHLLAEPAARDVLLGKGPRQEVYSCMAMFMDYWRTLDGILFANNAFVTSVRNKEMSVFHPSINNKTVMAEQAYRYGRVVGDHYKTLQEQSIISWENQFEKSQNWLRVTTLAQTYLIWEDNIRDRFLELINFEHDEISIEKDVATILSDTFGDLAKIRNSMWHAKSSILGICMFESRELKAIGDIVHFEKNELLKISAEQLPRLAFHISSKLHEFPVGYKLGEDQRKVEKRMKGSK